MTHSAPPAPLNRQAWNGSRPKPSPARSLTQTVTRADLEPLATKAELRILQWVVGIQSAVTLATFAIVAAKLL